MVLEIIGILGHAGTGKNYIAENVLPKLLTPKKSMVIAFADHFKVDAIVKYGADYNKVFGEKDYATRMLLQKTGTEQGRNYFGQDVWIRAVETWIKIHHERGIERFIISDCRFKNEVDWIKNMHGIIIKIIAPKRREERLLIETNGDYDKIQQIKNHASEKEIDSCYCDITINNNHSFDPFEQLKQHKYLFRD